MLLFLDVVAVVIVIADIALGSAIINFSFFLVVFVILVFLVVGNYNLILMLFFLLMLWLSLWFL